MNREGVYTVVGSLAVMGFVLLAVDLIVALSANDPRFVLGTLLIGCLLYVPLVIVALGDRKE